MNNRAPACPTGACPTSIARRAAAALLVLAALVLGACEGASHENIDRWMLTQKGPDKLKAALREREIESDLRAHAAQNLLRMDQSREVLDALEVMDEGERQEVLAKLIPRLWSDARVEGELTMPSPSQVNAKDALFELRTAARDQLQTMIDDYLIEWLTGGYYAGRARQGRFHGEVIISTIGGRAAQSLLASAKSIVAAPPDERGARPKIEEPLLVGLAATGNPDAVGFVLDLVGLDRGDPELQQRIFDSLYQVFIDNGGRFPLADGTKALAPHLDRLVKLAKDESLTTKMVDDVIRMLGVVGAPACIAPLVELVSFPHRVDKFTWVSANAALACGKAEALIPVAEALPPGRAYSRDELAGVIWEPIIALESQPRVAKHARTMLNSTSWVARIIGVEILGKLAIKSSAAEDAALIRALSSDKTVLTGWWGKQEEVPKAERKKEPRLGERAEEVAKQLDLVAQGG